MTAGCTVLQITFLNDSNFKSEDQAYAQPNGSLQCGSWFQNRDVFNKGLIKWNQDEEMA